MMMRQVQFGRHHMKVADDKPSFWDRVEAGLWEPELLRALDEALKPGTLFLDIGGWVGPTSLYAAACGADVIALEPDAEAARQFRANCAANPTLKHHIRLIEAALTPQGGPALFGSPRKKGDSMGSLLLAGRGVADWQADAISPAALIAQIPQGQPLVIKIDIEGGEYVLGEALGALAALQPEIVLIGFHPALILSAGGEMSSQLEPATRAIFDAFSPMKSEILGAQAGSPLAEALHTPITVRFYRG
jgi:FkbM family methyltransferase